MRKTYKPASRQDKLTKTYRKKTLDPKTRLNIIKDDDDLDNIEHYWKTAESVLKDDDTIDIGETSVYRSDACDSSKMVDEQHASTHSDTLFDIKSIKESLSTRPRITQDSSAPLKDFSVSEEKHVSSSFGEDSGFDDYGLENASEMHNDSEFSGMDTHVSIEAEIKHRKEFREEQKRQSEEKRPRPSPRSQDAKKSAIRKRLQSMGTPKTPEPAVPEYKGETISDSRGNDVAMTEISSLYGGRSAFDPLVATKQLETAVLFLNNLAFIKPERAACSFSVFMIKGAVCVEMNSDKITLKRGSVCVVEKGSTYSINNVSGTRCTILLTYSVG